MEQNTERKLLYYYCFKKMPRNYYGEPIFHLIFIDVKTGESITLGSCIFAEEVSNILGGNYYEDITEATNDFDILWDISEEGISPLEYEFEDVKKEYQRMINEGVSPEEINSAIITLYEEKRKRKTR